MLKVKALKYFAYTDDPTKYILSWINSFICYNLNDAKQHICHYHKKSLTVNMALAKNQQNLDAHAHNSQSASNTHLTHHISFWFTVPKDIQTQLLHTPFSLILIPPPLHFVSHHYALLLGGS